MGPGSIPATVLCAGGLLLFTILVMAKSYLLKTNDPKEITMNTAQQKSTTTTRYRNAILDTVTAVGAEVVSGLALLG